MRIFLAVLVLAVTAAGCDTAQGALEDQLGTTVEDLRGRSDDLLRQGQELATTFDWCRGAAQLARAVIAGDVEQARVEVEALRGDAPADLTTDLRTIAAAAARAQVGDPRQLMDGEVQQAARDVHAYAVDLCGLPGGAA